MIGVFNYDDFEYYALRLKLISNLDVSQFLNYFVLLNDTNTIFVSNKKFVQFRVLPVDDKSYIKINTNIKNISVKWFEHNRILANHRSMTSYPYYNLNLALPNNSHTHFYDLKYKGMDYKFIPLDSVYANISLTIYYQDSNLVGGSTYYFSNNYLVLGDDNIFSKLVLDNNSMFWKL